MLFSTKGHQISRFLQSIHGLCSSNHGKPRTIGCSGLRIILKETTHPKSPKSMCIGSDYSTIFPEAMGRPSITTTQTGQGSVCKDIWCFWAKSLSMKRELAPLSKRAWTWSWLLGVLICNWVEKTLLTCLDEMEPTLGCTELGLSNQMALILAGLIRLTPLLIGLGLQTYWTRVDYS